MNIEKLRIGMVIKNYKLMCEILDEEIKTNKKYQIAEWGRYFKYHKEGNKFIIDEIYGTAIERVDKRGKTEGSRNNNNLYGKYIEKLVLDLLVSQYKNTRQKKIYSSRDKMLRSLEMVNDNYSFGKFNRGILGNFISADTDNVKEFYILNNKNLYESVERAFKSLNNKCLVVWKIVTTVAIDVSKEDKEILNYDNKYIKLSEEHRPADEDEEEIILISERRILESMGLEGKKEAFLQDKYKEFNEKVCKLLKEETNILYYYKSYDVIFHEKVVQELEKINNWILEQEEKREIKITLNGIISNSMIVNAENRHEKASAEKLKLTGSVKERYKEAKINRRLEDTYVEDNNKIINTVIDFKKHNIISDMKQFNKDIGDKIDEELDFLIGL